MSAFADRIRGIVGSGSVRPGVAAGTPHAAPSTVQDLSALGGSWRDGCLVVERRMPPEARCGKDVVGDLAAQVIAAAHEAPLLAGGAPARPPFVFFDLETTGLSGGAGTHAFLVGCGWFEEDGGFTTRQYFLARFADERALLMAVASDLGRAGAFVSFNGKSFDAPLLETRFLFHRLEWIGSRFPHVDVLHPARRFWKDDDCSLVTLEQQVLGARREGDVPGFEIPGRYFQFVRTGNAGPLAAVLEHNRRDILSLAGLTARLLDLVCGGPGLTEDAREALALGYVYARGRDDTRALGAYERAVALASGTRSRRSVLARTDALRALALAYRRARRYEESAGCWTALLGEGCRETVEREALEALAIYHEHRVRNLAAAKTFALRGLTGVCGEPRQSWKHAAKQRLARIERKLNLTVREAGLLESE
jgi:uncharacterized protein YprB with RNaseH-like and TPR domain